MKSNYILLILITLIPFKTFNFGADFNQPENDERFAPSPDQPFGFVPEMSTFNESELDNSNTKISVEGTMPAKYPSGACIYTVPTECLSKINGQFICPTQIKSGQELSQDCLKCLYKHICEKIACKKDSCVQKYLTLEKECTEDLKHKYKSEKIAKNACSLVKDALIQNCNCYTDCQFCYGETA
jgi:hypothetical protein